MKCDGCKRETVTYYNEGDQKLCKRCAHPDQVKKRSPSRKNLLAYALGADIADIQDYQPGHHNPPMFQNAGSNERYIVLRSGEKPPAEEKWYPVSDFATEYAAQHNARILYTLGEEA